MFPGSMIKMLSGNFYQIRYYVRNIQKKKEAAIEGL